MTRLISVKHLQKYYPVNVGLLGLKTGYNQAVDDVSFEIEQGKNMGLVGESGCGKTTIGKTILLLQKPTAGQIFFDEWELGRLSQQQMRLMRSRLGIVYQNPHASLNPRMTVFNIVSRPLKIQKISDKHEQIERVATMFEKVGLNPEHMGRYPHEFSGGQKQRIAIARALITKPDFIVLDEPTSALDVSVQAQILKLLRDLQSEMGLTFLFISHDISVIRFMCDTVAVMYVGKLVEKASRKQLFANPQHPYTKALLSIVPIPDPKQRMRDRRILSGDIPSPRLPPLGCRFHPRCDLALPECSINEPTLIDIGDRHFVACHRIDRI